MKNIFGKFLALAAGVFALSSCNLDRFPEATRPYDGKDPYFQKASDVSASEVTVYTTFRGVLDTYLTDIMLQGFNAAVGYGNDLGQVHRTDATFNASNDAVEGVWGSHYRAMVQYNVIIAAADHPNTLESDFAEHAQFVKAEALVARAYSYIQLARHFGLRYNKETADKDLCVPYVVVYDQSARPSRATNAQIYGLIEEDLSTARQIFSLESSKKYLTENQACAEYFTLDVITALEARYLLDTQRYEEAAAKAGELVNCGRYSLSTSLEDLIKVQSEGKGTEAIMQLYADKTEGLVGYGRFTDYGQNEKSPTKYAYVPKYLPSQVLIDAYTEPSDLRRQAWLEQPSDPIYLSASFHTGINLFVKYKGDASLVSSGLQEGVVAAKPFMISEMYLIAAEASLAAGNQDDADFYLNALQSDRKASTTTATSETLYNEWFRETVGEGLFFFYLKRNNKGFSGREGQEKAKTENLLYTSPAGSEVDYYEGRELPADHRAFNFPIPTYEIQCNRNLVQNPGYGDNN